MSAKNIFAALVAALFMFGAIPSAFAKLFEIKVIPNAYPPGWDVKTSSCAMGVQNPNYLCIGYDKSHNVDYAQLMRHAAKDYTFSEFKREHALGPQVTLRSKIDLEAIYGVRVK